MAAETNLEQSPKEWLAIAEKDLEAAEYLFNGQHYQQAVFSFQQSVEKLLKGFGLFLGLIKDPRKSGHDTLKLYENGLKKSLQDTHKVKIAISNNPKLRQLSNIDDKELQDQYQSVQFWM